MRKYVLRRIPQLVPLIVFVLMLNFILIQLAPGTPLDYLVGRGEVVSQEYINRLTKEYGLDRSLHEQLLLYLVNIFRGNFGISYRYRQPAMDIIVERIPNTLLLMMTSILLAFTVGVVLGVASAKKPYSFTDNLVLSISILGFSVPTFWFGILLLLLFAVKLQWLPALGMTTVGLKLTGLAAVKDVMKHLLLPTIALGISNLAIYTRLTRASMLEELSKDYIVMAWGKGLDGRRVYFRHAFRNAMLPVITVFGLSLGFILAGATLIETVFAWPGLGRLAYESAVTRDYPVLMGLFLIVSITVVLANFIVDILYAVLDPRVRYT